VLVVGHAYAPGGQPVHSLSAQVVVGDLDKTVEVLGDRVFTLDGVLHGPGRFATMPLYWERAAGGPDTSNPVGRRLDVADRQGMTPLPNLQPPALSVTSRLDFIPPAGFGPVAPWWPSRQGKLHGGVARWDFRRWKLRPLPPGVDPGFFNAAPADQQVDVLRANERLVLQNLHREHPRLATSLVGVTPRALVELPGGRQEHSLRCDTLTIDTDRGTCALTWRGLIALDRPDAAGRVVVTTAPRREAAAHTIPHAGSAAPVLPFASEDSTRTLAAPIRIAGPAMPFRGGESVLSGRSAPGATSTFVLPSVSAQDSTQTFVPLSPLVRGPVLPFGARGSAGTSPATPPAPVEPSAADERETWPTAPAAQGSGLPFASTSGARPAGEVEAETWDLDDADLEIAAAPAEPPNLSGGWAAFTMGETPNPPPQAFPRSLALATMPLGGAAPWASSDREAALPPSPVPGAGSPPPAEEPPAPPPMVGPLATPEMLTGPASPERTARSEAEEPPAAPPREELADIPIELCAAITASIERRDGERAQILEENGLTEGAWDEHSRRWARRIQDETDRSRTGLLRAFDGAYVGRIEEERGPITEEEHARLVVAGERRGADEAMKALGLPRAAFLRIRRIWIARSAASADLGKRVRRAIELERER
jgi:hypothetical protein